MIEEGKPIFLQIADLIENDILEGRLDEGSKAPSTNEFAAFLRINPATAAKGVNRLVEEGILVKQRGIGMFVTANARAKLLAARRERFFQQYVLPLQREARKLGITPDQLAEMLKREDVTA